MTISTSTRTAGPFIGNNVSTTFAFTFKVFGAGDLKLVKTDTAIGIESTLAITTDYSVTLNSNQNAAPGGSVTLTSPLASGYSLIITSNIEATQETDLTNQGGFYPQVITNALDKLTILIQQFGAAIKRGIVFPIGDTLNGQLPPATQRANKAVVFDASGNVGVSVDNYVDQVGTVSASASSAASSASAASTSASSALTSLNTFKGIYYGPLADDPTLDPLGNAVAEGGLYLNTTANVMRVYTGSAWVAAYASLGDALLAANNLSDLDDPAVARANLAVLALTGGTLTGDLTGTKFLDSYGNVRTIPQSGTAKTASYTLTTGDIGEFIQVGVGGSVTIPNAIFAAGDAVSIFNNTSSAITITCTITTAYIAGTDSDKATMTLATRGTATILFISGTVCVVSGNVT